MSFVMILIDLFLMVLLISVPTISNLDIANPSTLFSCGRKEKLSVNKISKVMNAQKIIGNTIILLPAATGNYSFECKPNSQEEKTSTYSPSVQPYSFKFEKESNGSLLGQIYPMKDIYRVGEKIICESHEGSQGSVWRFHFASKSNHVPGFVSYEHTLIIDTAFMASVFYFFECDGRAHNFSVIREPYNFNVKINHGEHGAPVSISCSAEGSDVTFVWKTIPSLADHPIIPSEGTTLKLRPNISYTKHIVRCIAINAYDALVVKTVVFYYGPPWSDKKEAADGLISIMAPKPFYYKHERIECFSKLINYIVSWNCSRTFDMEQKFVKNSIIFLDHKYFSKINYQYTCECYIREDFGPTSDENKIKIKPKFITFVMRKERKIRCTMSGIAGFLEILQVICMILIIVSALGPCRYWGLYLTNIRDRRRYKATFIRKR